MLLLLPEPVGTVAGLYVPCHHVGELLAVYVLLVRVVSAWWMGVVFVVGEGLVTSGVMVVGGEDPVDVVPMLVMLILLGVFMPLEGVLLQDGEVVLYTSKRPGEGVPLDVYPLLGAGPLLGAPQAGEVLPLRLGQVGGALMFFCEGLVEAPPLLLGALALLHEELGGGPLLRLYQMGGGLLLRLDRLGGALLLSCMCRMNLLDFLLGNVNAIVGSPI